MGWDKVGPRETRETGVFGLRSWETSGGWAGGLEVEVSTQKQGLESKGHSLHFGFAGGLTLEAYVICGEDNQASWRLFRDDRWLHHWG